MPDAVLKVRPPQFTPTQAADLSASKFGVEGSARSLGSERDQTFLIEGGPSGKSGVLKISNPAENASMLDMEALAVLRVKEVEPGLPVVMPWVVPGACPDTDGVAAYRTITCDAENSYFLRMYDFMPGRSSIDPMELSDDALASWGEVTARLGKALRGFFHPSGHRRMLWDAQHTPLLRPLLDAVEDPSLRALVREVLDRFDEVVAPVWSSLRAQIVHGDVNPDNVLVNENGTITSLLDFGDMGYSALVTDLSSVVEGLIWGRSGEDMFRAARIVIDGFQRVTALEQEELRLLGELVVARSAAAIAIFSWRARLYPEVEASTQRWIESARRILERLVGVGVGGLAQRLGGCEPGTGIAFEQLLARRNKVMGPALEELTYERPLRIVSARGAWMTDTDGRQYLDVYNNVPVVGHCHPRVTGAIARQARTLNTNMRYLHATAVELGERLTASLPEELDVVMFVNSGSEANDLAWRMATATTGNGGGVVTWNAYHGICDASAACSPESWPGGEGPPHVERFLPPDAYRGLHLDTTAFGEALDRLAQRGFAPAALYLDGVLTSDGIWDLSPEYVQEIVRKTREAGGLLVADEVQAGYGRTGEAMWSFERLGVVPDFVSLGKPMGNGHPVAALITRREIAARFAEQTIFFSTFGGNPVAAAAALAVLEVIDDERLMQRATVVGALLRDELRSLMVRHAAIGDVRGLGLIIGVEIVSDRGSRRPDAALVSRLVNGMRERGVLVGSTGVEGNVLKVRPPLVFGPEEVNKVVRTLDEVLTEAGTSSR